MENGNIHSGGRSAALSEAVQSQIISAVAGIRFGAVEIIVHEGKVVQIERKEKVRIERPS